MFIIYLSIVGEPTGTAKANALAQTSAAQGTVADGATYCASNACG